MRKKHRPRAFADFSRASPYDFTHVALTLPLTVGGAGGEVLGLLQTEHSGINFNPFVNASHTDAERHYLGKDHLGSVRAVTNQWGSPLYMFDYDVFGTPLQDRPERFRHGFTGKEFDNWTGLYNYGFRDYASLYGRFTTVDPIQDGHNWYAYAVSDPLNWLDPWGLDTCPYAQSGEDTAAANVNPAHWRDNGDGTWTVTSEGATLWEVWGAGSYAVTGLTEEQARHIHVGETYGHKRDNEQTSESAPVVLTTEPKQEVFNEISKDTPSSASSTGISFSAGHGVKLALLLGLGVETGIIIDNNKNAYIYLSGSVGCGVQTPTTTKTNLSVAEYLSKSQGDTYGIALDSTQIGFSTSTTADICLGVVGTYDLNNLNSSGLPNSWSMGSIGGGVWKTGTCIIPVGRGW